MPDLVQLFDGNGIDKVIVGVGDHRKTVISDRNLDVIDPVLSTLGFFLVLDLTGGVIDVDFTDGELFESSAGSRDTHRHIHVGMQVLELFGNRHGDWEDGAGSVDPDRSRKPVI